MGNVFKGRKSPPPPPPPPPKRPPTVASEPKKSSQEDLVETARRTLGMDVLNQYNFAFVGQTGCGKSTLINSLRHMEESHPDAARVAEVEGTVYIKKYIYPTHPHVALWDFPGAGSKRQPVENYFERNLIYAFDCILILSSERFVQVDFDIAKKALDYKRPCAFVRTKADIALQSIVQRTGKTMLEASKDLRRDVTASFEDNLRKCGLLEKKSSYKLFIISAWAMVEDGIYINEDDESLERMDEDELIDFVFKSTRGRY